MKRIMAFVIGILMLTSMAWAGGLTVPSLIPYDANYNRAAVRPEALNTLLNAVTDTTAGGTAVDLGFTCGWIAWNITSGGTAPTDISVYLLGSIDGTIYSGLDSATIAAATLVHAYGEGKTRWISTKPVRYLKAGYTAKTGGDATTSVTIKAIGLQ